MPLFNGTSFAKRMGSDRAESPVRRVGAKNVFAADEPSDSKATRRKGSVSKLFWNTAPKAIPGVKLPSIGATNSEPKRSRGAEASAAGNADPQKDQGRSPALSAGAHASAEPVEDRSGRAGSSDRSSRLTQHSAQTEHKTSAHRRPDGDAQFGLISMSELKLHMLSDAKVQDEVIPSVCAILELTVAAHPEAEIEPVPGLEVFDGSTTPVSITAYVQRILKYSSCSTCNLVIGLMYLERLKTRHRKLKLTKVNIQRLLLVAIMTASKFFDDFYHNNQQWALIGGIGLEELNVLELDFLFLMTFDLNVQRDEYKSFVRKILVLGSGTPEKEQKKLPEVSRLASTPAPAADKEIDPTKKHNTIDLPSRPSLSNLVAGRDSAAVAIKKGSFNASSSFSTADTEDARMASLDDGGEANAQLPATFSASLKSVLSKSTTPSASKASTPSMVPVKLLAPASPRLQP